MTRMCLTYSQAIIGVGLSCPTALRAPLSPTEKILKYTSNINGPKFVIVSSLDGPNDRLGAMYCMKLHLCIYTCISTQPQSASNLCFTRKATYE